MKFWKKGPPILAISQLVHIGLSFRFINKTTHSEVFNFKSIYWLQYSNLNNSSRFLVYVINIFTYTSSHQTIAPDYIISPCFSLACNTLHLSPHTVTRSSSIFQHFPTSLTYISTTLTLHFLHTLCYFILSHKCDNLIASLPYEYDWNLICFLNSVTFLNTCQSSFPISSIFTSL